VIDSAGRQLNVRLLRERHRGPAAARNAGAAAATAEWLVFTDDDCEPDRRWLTELQAAAAREPAAMLGGRAINALDDVPASCASQLLIDYLYAYYNPGAGESRFFASCNIAIPREGFEAVGGFSAAFPGAAAEDRDLCDRWLSRGGRMVYEAGAVVYHRHHLTLGGFWRQHAAYGRGAFTFHRARRARGGRPIAREPLRFYRRLVLFPFTVGARRASVMSLLLFVSQVANAAGFFEAKVRASVTARSGGAG